MGLRGWQSAVQAQLGRQAGALHLSARFRLTNASILSSVRDLVRDQAEVDNTNKLVYLKTRQKDAIAFALKEREELAARAAAHARQEAAAAQQRAKAERMIAEAERLGGAAAAAEMRRCLDLERRGGAKYVKSTEAFADSIVQLTESFTGTAENRVIQWWENLYWNYVRYYFTGEMLIGKDRYGTKFTVTWNFLRSREEQRGAYRKDRNKRHHPYGGLPTDDRHWERWMRSHRADPPSVAEEEHMRHARTLYMGAMCVDDEAPEQAMVRLIAQSKRSSSVLQELDADSKYPDVQHALQPIRSQEPAYDYDEAVRNTYNNASSEGTDTEGGNANFRRTSGETLYYGRNAFDSSQTDVGATTSSTSGTRPGGPAKKRKTAGATWTLGFVRGDLFYNEEETEVMRSELGHVFANMEWQNLEYRRQIRLHKPQPPIGVKMKGDRIDPNAEDVEAMRMYWERTDLYVPYHDAVPDLTTPICEKLRIETDQLEDQRLAIRKELGLMDLGDIREGRDPIALGHDPFAPPPVSTRWKPKCWEESWGTGGGNTW